jgi:hypothetical protein
VEQVEFQLGSTLFNLRETIKVVWVEQDRSRERVLQRIFDGPKAYFDVTYDIEEKSQILLKVNQSGKENFSVLPV